MEIGTQSALSPTWSLWRCDYASSSGSCQTAALWSHHTTVCSIKFVLSIANRYEFLFHACIWFYFPYQFFRAQSQTWSIPVTVVLHLYLFLNASAVHLVSIESVIECLSSHYTCLGVDPFIIEASTPTTKPRPSGTFALLMLLDSSDGDAGITAQEFKAIIRRCDACSLYMTKRVFNDHVCQTVNIGTQANEVIDLTGDD